MVKVLTAKDLAELGGIKTSSNTNIVQILDKINLLLNTPVVKSIVGRLIAKYLGVANVSESKPVAIPPVRMANTKEAININGESIYNMLVTIVDKLILVAGNMTISELKEYLEKNKQIAIETINNAIKDYAKSK